MRTDNNNQQPEAFDGMAGVEKMQEQSEYLKRVADFAMYMQKEYIDGTDARSLLLCATDSEIAKQGRAATAFVALGKEARISAGISQMMKEPRMAVMFRAARAANLADFGSTGDVRDRLREERRHRRTFIGILVGIALWSLFLTVLDLVVLGGLKMLISLVSNLLLMGVTAWITTTSLRECQHRIARLEQEIDQDCRDKANAMLHHVMQQVTDRMVNGLTDDNDEGLTHDHRAGSYLQL